MKSRQTASLSAVALALAVALSQAQTVLAQDSPPKAAPDSAPSAAPDATPRTEAATVAANPSSGVRVTRTGSNIARVRGSESLPLLDIDRTYIDRSGATTAPELLRTVPQVQVGR